MGAGLGVFYLVISIPHIARDRDDTRSEARKMLKASGMKSSKANRIADNASH